MAIKQFNLGTNPIGWIQRVIIPKCWFEFRLFFFARTLWSGQETHFVRYFPLSWKNPSKTGDKWFYGSNSVGLHCKKNIFFLSIFVLFYSTNIEISL